LSAKWVHTLLLLLHDLCGLLHLLLLVDLLLLLDLWALLLLLLEERPTSLDVAVEQLMGPQVELLHQTVMDV
jgi:hypothetical protein